MALTAMGSPDPTGEIKAEEAFLPQPQSAAFASRPAAVARDRPEPTGVSGPGRQPRVGRPTPSLTGSWFSQLKPGVEKTDRVVRAQSMEVTASEGIRNPAGL